MALSMNKAQLARILGYAVPSQILYSKMRREAMTDEVLVQIGISPGRYKSICTYNRMQTIRLIRIFSISKSELEDVGIHGYDPLEFSYQDHRPTDPR